MSDISVHNTEEVTRHHKRSSSNKVLRTVTFVLTPFLILVISAALIVLCLAKPYGRAKPYVDLVFTDELLPGSKVVKPVNKYRDDGTSLNIKKIKDDETGEEHSIIYPKYGDVYGTVTCKAADIVDKPVYCGDGDDILQKGVGWFNGSVFIGHKGNVVLCAHNHTYFLNLPKCQIGDEVVLETDFVKQTYIVTQREVFYKTDLTYVSPTEDDRLTMYTCWNEGRLGLTDYRLAIVCQLQKREWKAVDTSE